MHIYTKVPHAYQMGMFIQSREVCCLMLINIIAHKAYAYEIVVNIAKEVLRSLNKFIKVMPDYI